MALPAFGTAADDEVEPVSPIAAEEASLGVSNFDDELLPRPEDDVEGQVADFLEQLPPGDAHQVVDALLGEAARSAGGFEVQVDDRSARIEESCEFLLRLLEFCSSAEQRQAVLQTWLRNNPREIPGKRSTSPTSASTDFLEVRRLQRLNSGLTTPAVALSSKAAGGKSKCFGREGGDALDTIVEFGPVREAFRSYDQQRCGRIDLTSLAQVLKAGGLSELEVTRLLQEAAGVSEATSEGVDYEAFLEWTFKT